MSNDDEIMSNDEYNIDKTYEVILFNIHSVQKMFSEQEIYPSS